MTSAFLASKWLSHLISQPLWLGLTTGEGQEIAGAGYARVQINEKVAQSDERSLRNNLKIVFVKADGDWPEVTGVSTWDSETGGNELLPGALEEPRRIAAGTRAVFDPGDIVLAVA